MKKPEPVGDEKVVYEGRIVEVVQRPYKVGDKVINFESVRRSPGVRLMIVKGDKILLTKEFRSELGGFDYRLPGGKVFDTLVEYKEALSSNIDWIEAAKEAAIREAREEVGHIINDARHIHTTSPGSTINWDLYYFLVEDSEEHEDGQCLEEGEVIEPKWFTKDEVKAMCLDGQIQEDRSVAVLLRYLEGVFN